MRWAVSAGYVSKHTAVHPSQNHPWLSLSPGFSKHVIWVINTTLIDHLFSLSLSTDYPLCLCPLFDQWSCWVSMDWLACGELRAGSPSSALHLHKEEWWFLRLVPWCRCTKERVPGYRRSINLQSPDFTSPLLENIPNTAMGLLSNHTVRSIAFCTL